MKIPFLLIYQGGTVQYKGKTGAAIPYLAGICPLRDLWIY